ncbi:MAG TPA: hypothetical protein VNS63_27295 [Blastocatellia bacterium]|nr:hypothetical protein [Blastocatellia bacterium]
MAQTLIDAGVLHPEDETARAMRHVLTGALARPGNRRNHRFNGLS